MNPKDPKKLRFSPQVTTAMALAAVLQILTDTTKNGNGNPLASSGTLDRARFKILTKENFASFQKIKESDITEGFLGYFSLLAAYCVLANAGNPREGPKRLVSIMPRTVFSAQYNKFIESKLKEQLREKSLYDIVKTISGSGDGLATEVFKWSTDTRTEIEDDWNSKADDLNSGNLQVGKFLNYLQGWDTATEKTLPQKDLVRLMDMALRHGQVGGLGDKMENMLDTNNPVPIFEFRDLDPIIGSKLPDMMGSYEDKVIDYHHQFAQAEAVGDKPSKGMSLSIVLEANVAGAFPSHLESRWEFYAIKAGESIGKCGEPEVEVIVADPARDRPAGWENADPHKPPWPAGIFELNIEGEACVYRRDGTNPGILFCLKKEITCVEDPMKNKKEEGTMMCTSYRLLHKVVYCDF
jgi:hypothetical protein